MIRPSHAIKYYSRRDVQENLVQQGKDREVVPLYNNQGFGKRPSILIHEKQVHELVKRGATSFHASEEKWYNPLILNTSMNKKQLDELRIGWDLILDVDTKKFEHAKTTTKYLIQAIEAHNVKNYSIKFSGNNGFHIGIPFEAFPKKLGETRIEHLFPELPKTIAEYLTHLIEPYLKKELGEHNVKIDTIFIAPRHLFRMAYSLHEKSGLASIVVQPEELETFKKEQAKPERVEVEKFLKNPSPNEAKALTLRAHYWKNQQETEQKKSKTIIEKPGKAVNEEHFPPCIKNISKGVEDGRKRSVFVLINFLRSVGWDWDNVEQYLLEWNEKNPQPLRIGYIKSQLKWHKKLKETYLPPNCKKYYEELRVCQPDNLCQKIKNPTTYALKNERNNLRRTKRNTTRSKKKPGSHKTT